MANKMATTTPPVEIFMSVLVLLVLMSNVKLKEYRVLEVGMMSSDMARIWQSRIEHSIHRRCPPPLLLTSTDQDIKLVVFQEVSRFFVVR